MRGVLAVLVVLLAVVPGQAQVGPGAPILGPPMLSPGAPGVPLPPQMGPGPPPMPAPIPMGPGAPRMARPGVGPGAGMRTMVERMMRQQLLPTLVQQLGLRDEQLQKIQRIQLDYAKTQIRLTSEVRVAQIELAEALLEDKVNGAQAERRARRISDLTGDLEVAGVRALLAAREVLRPAQWQHLKSMLLRVPPVPMVRPAVRRSPIPGQMAPVQPGMRRPIGIPQPGGPPPMGLPPQPIGPQPPPPGGAPSG